MNTTDAPDQPTQLDDAPETCAVCRSDLDPHDCCHEHGSAEQQSAYIEQLRAEWKMDRLAERGDA